MAILYSKCIDPRWPFLASVVVPRRLGDNGKWALACINSTDTWRIDPHFSTKHGDKRAWGKSARHTWQEQQLFRLHYLLQPPLLLLLLHLLFSANFFTPTKLRSQSSIKFVILTTRVEGLRRKMLGKLLEFRNFPKMTDYWGDFRWRRATVFLSKNWKILEGNRKAGCLKKLRKPENSPSE